MGMNVWNNRGTSGVSFFYCNNRKYRQGTDWKVMVMMWLVVLLLFGVANVAAFTHNHHACHPYPKPGTKLPDSCRRVINLPSCFRFGTFPLFGRAQPPDDPVDNGGNDNEYDSTSTTATRKSSSSFLDPPPVGESSSNPRKRPPRGPIRFAQLTQSAQAQVDRQVAAQTRHALAQQDPTLLAARNATYSVLATSRWLSSPTCRALQELCGVNQMTVVQSETYTWAREGWSLLVRSKTGTGKTLAALVPLLERVLEEPANQGISLLIVAPTRELAQQIGATAQDLITFHPALASSWVQVVYGGTKIGGNVRNLERQLPRILVATPGRLVELLDHGKIRGRLLKHVLHQNSNAMVWLDEADLLMESFGAELKRIMAALPRKRQTLLFSATWPKNSQRWDPNKKKINQENRDRSNDSGGQRRNKHRPSSELDLSQVLGEPIVGFQKLDCVTSTTTETSNAPFDALDESSQKSIQSKKGSVNVNVEEYFMVLPSMEQYVSTLIALLQQEIIQQQRKQSNSPAKIVVFFPAAKLVQFLGQWVDAQSIVEPLRQEQGQQQSVTVSAIHSRMSQAKRQRVSKAFREADRHHSVLFSSDVSARGMDYPNVTTVIQYGLPNTRELYLHRLGRTARAGQYGKGLLVALPFENDNTMNGRNKQRRRGRSDGKWMHRMTPWELDKGDPEQDRTKTTPMLRNDLVESAQAAYKAVVAYHVGQGYELGVVVDAANALAQSVGLDEIPELPENILKTRSKD